MLSDMTNGRANAANEDEYMIFMTLYDTPIGNG
jgi:hypothetical protein